MSNDTRKWCHSDSEEGGYTGDFDTREECIEDAHACYGGGPFSIGRATPVLASDHLPSISESVADSVYDNLGEWGEEWTERLNGHEDAMQSLLVEYINANCPPDCFSVEDAEAVNETAKDSRHAQ